jgi:acetaldehyde dehydrogenase (acetylating)
MAGFEASPQTSIICVEMSGVGKDHPLSAEKLSPVLSLYFVPDFPAALDTCYALLKFGGTGHTASIHAKNDARIREYGLRMPAMRVLVNTPSPQGSTGITTNVFPAMTLGCGAVAGNATSDNIGPQHLFNIKRIAWAVRTPQEAFEMPLDIDAAPASSNFACAAPVERATVIAAVDRYLAARGLAPQPASASNVVADVVDRFLAKKSGPEPSGGGYG